MTPLRLSNLPDAARQPKWLQRVLDDRTGQQTARILAEGVLDELQGRRICCEAGLNPAVVWPEIEPRIVGIGNVPPHHAVALVIDTGHSVEQAADVLHLKPEQVRALLAREQAGRRTAA
jgi:hypothetical protein